MDNEETELGPMLWGRRLLLVKGAPSSQNQAFKEPSIVTHPFVQP